jgi:RecA/RadA recombinase
MASNSLMSKLLKKAGKDDKVSVLSASHFFDKDMVFSSSVPLINLMLSGHIDGGIRPGLHLAVGDSRTFKTNFCLSLMKDYLDQRPNAVALFFDSEFGAKSSFASFGIDTDRVIHYALENIEDLKWKMVQALDEVGPGDEVFVFVDSISQIASKKEVENAQNENAAADMTRARELNSLFRIITPKLMLKKIPMFAINSYYDSMVSQYAEATIKGGKQVFLSSDVVLMVSRSQVKDEDKTLRGWSFNYNAMKSRYVKEKSKFSVTVTYEGGIDKYSGLFELATEGGFLKSEKQGFYMFNIDGFIDGKSMRRKDIEENHQDFFDALIKNDTFKTYVSSRYALETGDLFKEDAEVDPETGEVI